MKRYLYIALFTLLGLIVATLIHALIELPTLALITGNFEQYQHSFVWQHWKVIHGVGGALLWALGLVGGFLAGKKWWQILYVEKRRGTPRW